MVTGWIIIALEPQIAGSILYVDTARAILLDLEEHFGQASSAQLYALEQEVAQVSQDNVSISDYYTQLKKLLDEIDNLKPLPACECANCTCEITQKVLKLQQDQRLMIFLMKMSNEFGNVRLHILMLDNLPNLPQAYRMLLQEQRHKEISKMVIQEPVALVGKNNFRNQFSNPGTQKFIRNISGKFYSGNTGSTGFQQRKVSYFCDQCKVPGHSKERCFKFIGYPPGFKANQQRRFASCATAENVEDSQSHVRKDSSESVSQSSPTISVEQYNQLMTLLAQNNLSDQENSNSYSRNALLAGTSYYLLSSTHTNSWIIDSGASDHMCSSMSSFHTVKEISGDSFITIPDGAFNDSTQTSW